MVWHGEAGKAGLAGLGKTNEMGRDMRIPTDDEIMRALCCGGKCAVGPNTGYCHRWDFTSEAARIRALLDQHGEMPTCMDRASEPEEASQSRSQIAKAMPTLNSARLNHPATALSSGHE
jgi:hypothetical protein